MFVYVCVYTNHSTRSSNISKAGAHFTSSGSQLLTRQVCRPFLPKAEALLCLGAHSLSRPSHGPTSHQAG